MSSTLTMKKQVRGAEPRHRYQSRSDEDSHGTEETLINTAAELILKHLRLEGLPYPGVARCSNFFFR